MRAADARAPAAAPALERLPAAEGRPVLARAPTRAVCAALRSRSQIWAERAEQLARRSEAAAVLLEELFCALYDETARLNPDTAPEFHRPFGLLADMMPLTDFQRLRERSAGDAVAAALAAWRLAERLADGLEPPPARRRRWLWPPARRDGDQRPVEEDRPRGRAAAVPPRWSVIQAVRDVRGMADADEMLRRAWGIGPGRRGVHPLDDIWRTVEEVRALPDFAVLTDALEQFRALLGPVRRRRRTAAGRGVERLVGWETGSDLERVIPEESARLADPDLQPLFVEAYEHRRLLQIRYEGEDDGPTGPIVCCMDASRSMNTPAALGRERFLWAKAVALALLDLARRTRRPFVGLCFAGEHELETFEFPAGGGSAETAAAMAACDFDGGTHFQAPLEHALRHLEQAAGRGGGHIVFITDGQAQLPEGFRRRFLAAKARLNARLLTVFIDGGCPELAALSDRVFTVASRRLASWEAAVAGLGQSVVGRDLSRRQL